MARRNRFSTCARRGEPLLRIKQRVWIEAVPQASHHFQFGIAEKGAHEILLLHSHSVFSGNGSTNANTELEDLSTSVECALGLIGITSIEQNQWVQVPIAGMKDIPNRERVLSADLIDLAQSFWHTCARDDAVLNVVRRRDASDRSECGFAPLP